MTTCVEHGEEYTDIGIYKTYTIMNNSFCSTRKERHMGFERQKEKWMMIFFCELSF